MSFVKGEVPRVGVGKAKQEEDIPVSPMMAEAGLMAMYEWAEADDMKDSVTAIYRAMEKVRRKESGS